MFGTREQSFLSNLMGIVGILNIGKVFISANDYTIKLTDNLIVCNKSYPTTWVLPKITVGHSLKFKNVGSGTATVDGLGFDTIDGELAQDVYTDDCMDIQAYATGKWAII